MSEMKDLIAIFKAETEDHLVTLENGLVKLEKDPDDLELARSLNREVHTLKGAARVFGFSEIQEVAHRIEDIFEKVVSKSSVFSSLMAERIFKGLDAIRTIMEKIVQEREIDVDVSDVCRKLETCIAGNLDRTGSEPNKEEKKDGQALTPVKEGTSPPVQRDEYIRVPLSRVDKLLYLVGEMVIHRMKSSAKVDQAKRLSKLCREVQKSIVNLSEAMKKDHSPQNAEMTKWLSHCAAQTQKLREHTLRLYDQVSMESFHLDPIIDELQTRIKEVKMLPLSTIFEGFPRMLRDIASQQGKEVNLVISGEETELDKKVMEGIRTSLIHLLRNCIDHGIEEPEMRTALGKPAYGTINVSASHEGDNVVITVEDDGRGLDIDQIKQTALKRRVTSIDDLEGMTDKEVFNLIFMNGYSTSPIVTDVSGRGMGLDIVKRDITHLKGRVILDTKKNSGTKFTLVLPLTIAIIHVLLAKVREMLFAFPISSISETVKVNMEDLSSVGGRMAFSFHDQSTPLVWLGEVLGLPHSGEKEEEKAKETTPVVIVSSIDRRVGFMVDDIVGDEEVFVKSLGKHLGKVRNVSGAMVMATGEVAVVLDIEDLMDHSALSVQTVTGEKKAPTRKQKEKRILVVEDAFSTRELEKSILETHGYLVDTAVDGLDALERITGNKYDLILSDIEMPRMDGFELCRTLKKNDGYKEIPFVMVTARQKEEDKRRGMEVGAAAYIVKSGFEQTNLLDTIERLVG
ncbi:MAG: hybrid sensor histidine kinase/response regulator [Thermodesulfobacteriota bacterium]